MSCCCGLLSCDNCEDVVCLKHGHSAGCNAQIHLSAERGMDNDDENECPLVVQSCERSQKMGCYL